MKRLFLAIIVLIASVSLTFGQQKEHKIHFFGEMKVGETVTYDEASLEWGDYKIDGLFHTKKGSPLYFGVKNKRTGDWVYRPSGNADKLGFSYDPVEGNIKITFVNNSKFLKESDGYHPAFEGMVWIIPYEGVPDETQIYSGGKRRSHYSGIFKIDNERLVPVLADYQATISPMQIEGIPLVSYEKDGKTAIYDINSKPVTVLEGSITWEDGKFFFNKANGTKSELTLNLLSGVDAKLCKGEDGKWGAVEEDGQIFMPFVFEDANTAWKYLRNSKVWSIKEAASKKDEFETQAEYENRLKDNDLMQKYLHETDFMRTYALNNLRLWIGEYNAENEEFPISAFLRQNEKNFVLITWMGFTLKVPRSEARAFKEAFNAMEQDARANAKYGIRYNSLSIENITFTMPDGKSYSFSR